MRASEGMNKMGILWKLRLPEQEISIAEESGPVRTFRCQRMLFEKLRREEVREGCFIEACFCMEKRMIVEVESVMLEGYVTKWAPKYAFVHANVLPQIKLLGNNRVAELKFMHNPPSSLSSIYLDPQECSFPLENNMAVRFALIANLKKTTNLRNSPYCDMKAIKVTKMKSGQKSLSRRGSSQSSQAVNDVDARLDSWFSRRMSSPRTPRSSGRRTPESRTPEPKFLDEGFRKRGGSTPVKKHVKRDPASQKRKRPPQSAPVTPAKDMEEPDLRQLINMKMPHLSKSRPSSANSALENPPTKMQNLGNRCLRCVEDNIELCTHKPPTTHSRNQKEPKGKVAEEELSLILQSKDAECERLRQVVDNLRLQLSQKQNSPSNVQPSYNYKREYKQTPSLHVSYDQAIKNKHYDTIFAHSPSVSPSSSPVPDMFQDPEKFLPFLSSGGKPSSSRSDIMMADRSHGFDPMAHHHYGTPMTQHAFDPDEGGYFESCSSSNSTPSWTTNSEQLSARECMDYYEPSSSLSRECAISILQPRKDLNSGKRQKHRRKSPREMSEVLYVPPLKLPPATLDGERSRTRPKSHLPLVNQDLNKADTSRWAPVGGEERPDFSYLKKSRYSLPSRKQPKTSAYKNWDF